MRRAATLLLALLLALPALALPAPPEAAARTRLSRDVTRITLRVPIQLLAAEADHVRRTAPDDSGDEVEPADWFEEEAEAFWNPALASITYNDCYTFALDAGFKPITSEAEIKPGNHLLRFEPERSPDQPFLTTQGDPFEEDLEAVWGWAPIGPQLGYFLGLGEAVEEIDTDTVERLGNVAEQQLGPLPACVDAIGERREGDGRYSIYARQTVEVTINETEFGQFDFTVLEVWAAPDGEGNMTGEATFTFAEYSWSGDCEVTATGGAEGLPVTGRRDGERVELEVTGEFLMEAESTCAGHFEFTRPLVPPELGGGPLVLAGVLADGRFEETTSPTTGMTVHTLIVEGAASADAN